MDDQRADPDQLLKQVQTEENTERRGKLRIYLGAAPGVGKTYAMLKDAIAKIKSGTDVVIGIIESHGREDIEALLSGIEKLSLQAVSYHGKILQEFSIDDAIKRHPQLILMDEMAHTNVPGLRHIKRWQDIRELLDNQIDVYTTLNVQHLESLNDDVSRIVHAPIRETVPDFMFDMAGSVEVVDLPTEELLRRLHDGKIYMPERASVAAKHFFLPGNLIALRELALRVTAQRVGKQVQVYREDKGIRHIWSSHEKIMVCVGPGVESLQLIRNGKQLAESMKCSWIAVHVKSPLREDSDSTRKSAILHLRLAEQLGAETTELVGTSIAETVIQFAHRQNITLIMVWKPTRPRWQEYFTKTIADAIVHRSAEIDVYIMTGAPSQPQAAPPSRSWFDKFKVYVYSIPLVGFAAAVSWALRTTLPPAGQIILFLLAVIIMLARGGFFPAIFTATLTVIAYHWLFIPFPGWMTGNTMSYFFLMFALLFIAVTIGCITLIARRQSESAHIVSWQAGALYRLNRQLITTASEDKIILYGEDLLSEFLNTEVAIFTTNKEMQLVRQGGREPDPKENVILLWVFRMRQMAGFGTDTLPNQDALYLPLIASQGILGVLKIHSLPNHPFFPPEQVHLLESCASQIALAIEINRLKDQTYQSSLQISIEHDRMEFMQSIARDLNSPLTSILTYARMLESLAQQKDPVKILKAADTIYHEANKISLLVDNILQISWLDHGFVKPSYGVICVKEMIQQLIAEHYLTEAKFVLDIPDDLPGAAADKSMLRIVLLNLLDNAVRFSPVHDVIRITATCTDAHLAVCVENHGPQIPVNEIEVIFEKYYQSGSTAEQKGLGLGLAICKKIIQTHNGKIWAENRKKKGVAFCFTVPTEQKNK